jgi:basic membrane protein A
MDGTWKTGFYYGTIKDGMIGLAPYGPKVTAATKAKIAAKRALIASGTWNEFSGPIYDQKGKLRIKKGDRPTVKELYAMDWLVKGIIGSAKG